MKDNGLDKDMGIKIEPLPDHQPLTEDQKIIREMIKKRNDEIRKRYQMIRQQDRKSRMIRWILLLAGLVLVGILGLGFLVMG